MSHFSLPMWQTVLLVLMSTTINIVPIEGNHNDNDGNNFLQFNEKNKLIHNVILYQNNSHCLNTISAMWHERNVYSSARDLIAMTDNQFFDFITENDKVSQDYKDGSTTCFAACVNYGTSKQFIKVPLPHFVYREQSNSTFNEEDYRHQLLDWNYNCRTAEISVVSFYPEEVTLLWIDALHPGYNKSLCTVRSYSQWLTSFLGHQLVAVKTLTKEVVYNFTVIHSTQVVLGREYNRDLQKHRQYSPQQDSQRRQTSQITWKQLSEVKRTFSQLGFAHGEVPRDVWASMQAYYYNNQDQMYFETGDNLVISNHWDRSTMILAIPVVLMRYWQSRLRELVEAWIGGDTPLENTFVYGIRRYADEARLMLHVDRIKTHAVSLIVNIDQQGMREDWPLEVFDFAGRLHEVFLQPGQLVYYESARCVHSRAQPLKGDSYSNLFFHYRPKVPSSPSRLSDLSSPSRLSDPSSTSRLSDLWFEQPSSPSTPPPLLQLGDCLPRTDDNSSSDQSGGFICGELELPYLKSTDIAIASGDDIYNFWNQFTVRESEAVWDGGS